MIEQSLHLAALIAAITALGFWLEHRFSWASKVGAGLLIIAMGALVSNLGFVPLKAPVYDVVFGPVTSLAIVWLLMAVDLRDLKSAGPSMLTGYLAAMVGTALGALCAGWLFAGQFAGQAWKLVGVMTGTYTGGSLNFVAVGRELALPDELFTAATAADNVLTAVWFGVTLLLPAWLYRRNKKRHGQENPAEGGKQVPHDDQTQAHPNAGHPDAGHPDAGHPDAGHPNAGHPLFSQVPLRIVDVCILIAVGLALLVLASWMAQLIPGIPEILWLTTLSLITAQWRPIRNLCGALQLGSMALHFFFALIGIGSRFSEIMKVGPAVFYFTLTVVGIHGLVLFGFAKLRRLDWDTAAVASQAAVGGPSTAMALAVARAKPGLALPGIAVGLLGYGLGTYMGFATAHFTRYWWG